MFTGKLQAAYTSVNWFRFYDALYQIAQKLGFADGDAAWEANPKVIISGLPYQFAIRLA